MNYKNVSNQSLTKSRHRPGAYWEQIRDKLKTTEAAKVINRAIDGEPIEPLRLKACMYVVDKTLPNLQAVAMDVRTTQNNTMEDVNAKLLLAGIQPQDAWKLLTAQPGEDFTEGALEPEGGTPPEQVDPDDI